MTDRRKIILGSKDVVPKKNEDIFVNIELSRSTDELAKEIINNNFNLLDQFNKERDNSLKFCLYGTLDSNGTDVENVSISIKTNHEDLLYTPKKEEGIQGLSNVLINSKKLSKNGSLSQNIFKKKKGSYYFLFELDRNNFINNNETKSLILEIDRKSEGIYHIENVPFLYYDSEGNKIPYGTDTVDINLSGDLQTIENDYPFFYGTHWIRRDLLPSRPSKLSFFVSEENQTNSLSVDENDGVVNFVVALDSPSLYGLEQVDVVIKSDNTIRNPEEDYVFETQQLNWEVGEQYKTVNIQILDDLFVESAETITFGFENLFMAEEDELNEFNLTILDDDTPTPIGFLNASNSIIEANTNVTVDVFFERAMNVPNQTVDVVLDSNLTTAIIGKDFENTGTEENPEFRKTLYLTEGEMGTTFSVEIYDDFDYEFTKQLVFKFENPSQNVDIIPSFNSYVLNVEDSMITQYTRYNFNNDSQNGFGIFRMAGPINVGDAKLEWANNSDLYGFTNSFTYDIEIINRGVDIIYKDEIIGANEPVLTQSFSGGYEQFIIDLPSNSNLDESNKKYTESQYEFTIKNIESLPGQPSSIFDEQLDKNFSNLEIPIQSLSASGSGQTEYYLASKVLDIKTRYRPQGGSGLNPIEAGCTDQIQNEPVDIKINGTILLNNKLKNPTASSTFNLPTRIHSVGFVPERIDVSDCVEGQPNVESTSSTGVTEVSRTLLLPLNPTSQNLLL